MAWPLFFPEARLALASISLASAALWATTTFAQSIEEQVTQQLRAQGFDQVEIRRTLLGRVRVLAEGGNMRRELVFNPSTGEILRDFWEAENGQSGGSLIEPSRADREALQVEREALQEELQAEREALREDLQAEREALRDEAQAEREAHQEERQAEREARQEESQAERNARHEEREAHQDERQAEREARHEEHRSERDAGQGDGHRAGDD